MVHVNQSLRSAPNVPHVNRIIATKPSPKNAAPVAAEPGPSFLTLFSGNYKSPTAAPTIPAAPTTPAASTAPPAVPTAESMFGPNPWIANPTGKALTNGVTYSYNPYYFATPATAQKVAQMVGGKVVESNAITQFGPFQQSHPNQMVELPSGRQINAGLFASFYDHGYSQSYIDRLVSSEINDRPA